MNKKSKIIDHYAVQCSAEHYSKNYDTKERFISYWHQINEVLNTHAKKVLVIGIGNSFVPYYLRKQGLEVTTVDIASDLKPDYVCSVTDLTKAFKPNSFDCVLCAEVLEHLPFKYFEEALKEIYEVANPFAIISLPHFGMNFRVTFKLPTIKAKTIILKLPYPQGDKVDPQHYWEIGRKGYPLHKVLSVISKLFTLELNYLVLENPYHRFFVLRTKKGEKKKRE